MKLEAEGGDACFFALSGKLSDIGVPGKTPF
jgi:hypothetical protein